MPILYPPVAPVLNGDFQTIHRFLKDPAMVQRRLRELADMRFIADTLLTGSVEATGGAVAYDVNESIYTDRDPSPVAPGGEYERALATGGTAALANVTKYGQDVPIVDEAIGRQKMNAVDRAMKKAINRAVAYIDTITLAAIAAAVTQTQTAVASWSSGTADPLADVQLAVAQVLDLTDGFEPDTLVLTNTLYARLTSNTKVLSGLEREGSSQITATGQIKTIGGLIVRPAPASRMPAGIGAIVLDSGQLGDLAWENIPSPEYQGSPDGVQSWIRRDPSATDSWLLRVRRTAVPIVREPSSAVKLTGV